MCVSEGKKCLFFGKYGVLCFLETLVLRFALLPYYRRSLYLTGFAFQNKDINGKSKILTGTLMNIFNNFTSSKASKFDFKKPHECVMTKTNHRKDKHMESLQDGIYFLQNTYL